MSGGVRVRGDKGLLQRLHGAQRASGHLRHRRLLSHDEGGRRAEGQGIPGCRASAEFRGNLITECRWT